MFSLQSPTNQGSELWAARHPRLSAGWRASREAALEQAGPVLVILIVLCAGLWALAEYAKQRAEVRIAETERYIAQFEDEPVAGAWRRLSLAWHEDGQRQLALLRRMDQLSGEALADARANYRALVLETIDERRLADDVDAVLRFWRRLALCIRIGSCDRAAARARFGDLPWQFRDRHHVFLVEQYVGEDLDRHFHAISPRPQVHAARGPRQKRAPASAARSPLPIVGSAFEG